MSHDPDQIGIFSRPLAWFEERFEYWKITIPAEDIATRRRGEIVGEHGWYVQYLFGADEHGEYVDYYASHRMTDDEHRRLRPNGSVEDLPIVVSAYIYREEIPGDRERAEGEYLEENRRAAELLDAKGFGLTTNGMLRAGRLP